MDQQETNTTFKNYVYKHSFNDYKSVYTDKKDLISVYDVLVGYSYFKKHFDSNFLALQDKLLETYGLLATLLRNIPPECIDVELVDNVNLLYRDLETMGLDEKLNKFLN